MTAPALASRVPAVIDYLVTTWATSPSLGLATPAVTVIDGENVTEDLMANQRLLWVGYNRENPLEVAAAAPLDWPNLDHALTLDETGDVVCTAEFWSGDTTMKTNRDGCAAIVNACAASLKGLPAQGGPGDTTMGGLCFWSRVAETSWLQEQKDDGAAILCVFKVAYYARIAD